MAVRIPERRVQRQGLFMTDEDFDRLRARILSDPLAGAGSIRSAGRCDTTGPSCSAPLPASVRCCKTFAQEEAGICRREGVVLANTTIKSGVPCGLKKLRTQTSVTGERYLKHAWMQTECLVLEEINTKAYNVPDEALEYRFFSRIRSHPRA